MRRRVFDTNIYVDWINSGLHEDVLFERGIVRHMSAVVLMELRAGAFAPKDRRLIERLERTFRAVERLVVPSQVVYSDAGDVLRLLQSRRGYRLRASHSIVNDVLIALSARTIGATVVTQNRDDYRAIHSIRPFQLQVV